jgi:Tol biopolymer transport system component
LLIDAACAIGSSSPGSRVVEVGCGTGKLTGALLERALRVEAVDPGRELIEVARRRVGRSSAQFLMRSGAPDQEPAWSPDGARIAFASQRHGNWELYSMRADGLEQRRLTRTRTVEGAPSWSPDGLSLAFYRVTGGRADLWVARADGTAARRLTRRAGNEVDPTWSPDGTTLAFATDRRGRWTIDVVRTDGTARTTVAIPAGAASHPDWQPVRAPG